MARALYNWNFNIKMTENTIFNIYTFYTCLKKKYEYERVCITSKPILYKIINSNL